MCIRISLFRLCFFSPGPIGGPHSPSVWSNCGSKSPRVPTTWFQLFSEKVLVGQMILVLFCKIMEEIWTKVAKFHISGAAYHTDLVDP